MKNLFINKINRVVIRKIDAFFGRLTSIKPVLVAMSSRPFELHLELTNLCNCKCIFCPYQFQTRSTQFMSDEIFEKSVSDFCEIGGGSVCLMPIVGDALIDPKFLERVRYLRKHPEIDRIFLTTNGVLLDQFGINEIIESGITSMDISTSGFHEDSYKRLHQSNSYLQMKINVHELLEKNSKAANPIQITLAIRTDRTLEDVMSDPDMQPILNHNPAVDFTWSYTSANGRITAENLPASMKLRKLTIKKEACVQTYNGPIVLPDGKVLICSCVAASGGEQNLQIGHILENDLKSIWTSNIAKKFRATFGTPQLNPTCNKCDMYRDLELYRTREGRERAQINDQRRQGIKLKHTYDKNQPFMGG